MTGWRQALLRGAIIGLAGGLAFLGAHALVVEPIWGAWWRALPYGAYAGALLALAHHRLQREALFASPLGGMIVGGLAGIALAPFAIVGWMRARAAPDPFWILILALLVTSVYHLVQAVQEEPGRLRRLELFVLTLAANALPMWFLVFSADFHDEVPDPYPIALALGTLYVAAGAVLTGWNQRAAKP